MADRIVVLRDGRVEQAGPPLEIYDRPINPFVAGFIGSPSMNLFAGRVAGSSVVLADGAALPLPTAVDEGMAVTYGVRPEHLEIVDIGTPGGIEATVAVVEPTGAETMIFARRDAMEITATFRSRPAVRPGEPVTLRPDAAHVHLFAAAGRLN